MIIKRGKEFMEAGIICVGILIMIFVMFIRFEMYRGLVILFSCIIIVGCVRHMISLGRVLLFEETGCTVVFLWYKKKYLWDELQVKRVEEYSQNCKRRWHISDDIKVVVFAPHKIYKKKQWTAERYSMYIHPLSVFYVYIIPERELNRIAAEKIHDNYLSYVAEEKVFLEKMKEWNVELEDITDNKKAYNYIMK